MLMHVLAILDIFAAGTMVLGHYHLVKLALLYAAVYLIVKLPFYRDFLSWIDAACGVYIILIMFGYTSMLTWVFLVYFIYKTLVWLFFALAS